MASLNIPTLSLESLSNCSSPSHVDNCLGGSYMWSPDMSVGKWDGRHAMRRRKGTRLRWGWEKHALCGWWDWEEEQSEQAFRWAAPCPNKWDGRQRGPRTTSAVRSSPLFPTECQSAIYITTNQPNTLLRPPTGVGGWLIAIRLSFNHRVQIRWMVQTWRWDQTPCTCIYGTRLLWSWLID